MFRDRDALLDVLVAFEIPYDTVYRALEGRNTPVRLWSTWILMWFKASLCFWSKKIPSGQAAFVIIKARLLQSSR